MTPHFLQTTDEAAMWAALTEMGLVSEHEGERYITAEHSIIGHWFERTGGTDEEPIMEQVPGWHFNLLLPAEPAEWPDTITQNQPVSPWRVWG